MKRFVLCVAAALLLAGCGENREGILKVYNWGDYIDEDLIPEFEQWYKEQTGEDVTVVYQTFDINETMLSKIEKGHEDYDVVCPSDYIIERMLASDLLLPVDRDFGDTPNYIDANIAPYIKNCFKLIDGNGKDANDYAVGYMWGTTGFLYNTKYVDKEDTRTWDILRNPKYAGKIFVKDAPRDIYAPILIYLRQDELKRGETTPEALMYDSSEKALNDVEAYMSEVKNYVAGWEADFGKEQMTQEKGWLNMTWSGDAQWAIEEASEVGVSLDYTVPEEGSSVWFDGWVIPRYARNTKAAGYFINFLCRPDNAVRNMDYIGYVSTIGVREVMENMEDDSYEPRDLSYFFGEGADSACLNPVMYPGLETIRNCTMMHDWGDRSHLLIEMWSRVKGDNATAFTYIVISVTFTGLIAFEIYKKASRHHRLRRRKKHLCK